MSWPKSIKGTNKVEESSNRSDTRTMLKSALRVTEGEIT